MLKRPHYNWMTLVAATFVLAACTPAATASPQPTTLPTATDAATDLPVEPTAEPTEAVTEPAEQPGRTFEITDSYGTTIILDGPAQRIVSLAPSNTEIIFAVGAGDQLVGRDSFSDYPEEALAVTDVGGGWSEFDIETIVSLEPDLVLSADIIAPEQVQALRDLGLTVFNVGNPEDMDGLLENMVALGRLTGHRQEAAAATDALRNRAISILQLAATAESNPLVFYQIDSTDPSAPWTTGPGTFIDYLITLAGGRNVGAVLADPWSQISLEELIVQNPDIILMGDAVWTGETVEDLAARPGWGSISAVQTGTIYIFDDNLVSRPGPRLVDGLVRLVKIFHPELFD